MGYEQPQWHRIWRFLTVISILWSTGFVLPIQRNTATANAASRATNFLQNGSFEAVTGGVPDNWSVVGTVIDLGVTSLGGCVSVDTTDYSTYAGGQTSDVTNGTHASFTVSIVNSGGFGSPTQGSNVVYLNLGGGNASPGYHIKHGPAIVSDPFKGIAGQLITLNWYSAAGSDDFAVLGYLLDTDANGNGVVEGTPADCAQTEVLDRHGTNVSGWQYASVTVPDSHDFYRFVFVNGTHDLSGGMASGASFWIDNISQGTSQTVTFSLSGVTANYYAGNSTPAFQLPGSSTSGLPVSYTSSTPSKCTVTTGGVLTVVGAGTCTITALQSGGETGGILYAASPSVTQSFTITNIAATAQTITFTAPADRMATDADFSLTATATSGLAVTFTSSTTSVCTVSGTTVSLLTTGTCTIVAAQAGGANSGTNYAAAATVTRSFLLKGTQTVTFGALGDKDSTAANFSVSATSSVGLTVTFTSTTPSVCTVTSGGTVDVLTPGTCTISADQAGGATGGVTYVAATSVTQSFTVRTPQTITFAALSDIDQDAAAFTLTGTADSGLTVTYASSTPAVCTVTSAGEVTLVTYGTCTLVADQSGGTNAGTSYSAATSVTRSFASRRLQTISFSTVADVDSTDADFALTATASSGIAVTYSASTPAVCTVTSGGTVSIVGPGTCTITAAQSGGVRTGITYATAPTVTQSFIVRTPQTITFSAPSDIDQTAAAFALTATSDSGLTVTYTSSTPSVCSVTSSGTVTLVSYGTCTIVAAQIGGTNAGTSYSTAATVTRSFTSRRTQTITFGALVDQNVTAADFAVTATSDSGLAVTFTSTTSGTCTVTSSGTVSIVASGLCTIVAAQTGGSSGGITYAVASTVSQSFTIRTGQVITFAQPADIDASAGTLTLSGSTSSPLAVSYTSSTPSVCTVTSSGVVTLVTYGTCTITAAQAGGVSGGVTYASATSVTRSFESRRAQTITFAALTNKIYTSGDFSVIGTASSTLAVSFSSSTPSICTVSGTTVSMVTVGRCTIVAAQLGGVSGGTTYAVAPAVSQSFNTLGVPQTITFPSIPNKKDYDLDFVLPATASSGLTVSYVTNNTSVCTITPQRKLHIYGIGTCIVTATQAGGTSAGIIYAAAAPASQTFQITDETPTPSRTATATATKTNTPTQTATKTPTPPGIQLKKAAIGASFTLGLLMNGTLVTWGMNKEYQTNIPPCCGSKIQDIAVGTNFAVALRDGVVYGWGSNSRGQITIPKTAKKDITAIAAGYAHVMALNKNGTVVAWGNNESGQTKVPKTLKLVTSIAAGHQHSIALKKDGTITIWGRNDEKQAVIPAGLRDVKSVSAGFDHTMVLKTDGTVVCWGANGYGQSRVPDNVRDIKQISAGSYYSLALGNNGSVYAWGRNDFKQIEIPEGYRDIAVIGAGYVNTVIGLRDGRILAIGAPENDALVSRTPTKTATPTP